MGPHPTDGSQDDENASNVTGKEVDSSKIIPPNSSPQVGDGASPTAAGGREQTNNGMGRDGGVYGVAVGITVVVLILIALGIWWLVWWKKQKREKEEMRIEMMRQEQAS
jgi:cbb3-type cytochrome oxidase subunit 3